MSATRGNIFPPAADAATSLPGRESAAGRDRPQDQSRAIFLTGLFGGLVTVALLAIYLAFVS